MKITNKAYKLVSAIEAEDNFGINDEDTFEAKECLTLFVADDETCLQLLFEYAENLDGNLRQTLIRYGQYLANI